MKWLEVVVLRTEENIGEQQVSQWLKQCVDDTEMPRPHKIITYRNIDVETDLCFHIVWDTDEIFTGESRVKYRLIRLLKPFGLICHSGWKDTELT